MKYKYLVTYSYFKNGNPVRATQEISSKRELKYCHKDLQEFINKESGNTPNIDFIYPLGRRASK